MQERLQKVLAANGIASRRKCEELILQGRVKVNGQQVSEFGLKVSVGEDRIEVDGQLIGQQKSPLYILFYKPTGVITSTKDPQGRKVVTDFLSSIKERVYPVGRLDYDTSGLLLLTNDGDLANKITHPRYEMDKVYLATVRAIPSGQSLLKLERGVLLEDGMTYPANVKLISEDSSRDRAVLQLIIHEGRNRQVRRMCAAVGHPVVSLERIQLGFLTLEGLRPGQYRFLESWEVDKLKALFD
jgi:23S rRNA pseudouridine2605 synthase